MAHRSVPGWAPSPTATGRRSASGRRTPRPSSSPARSTTGPATGRALAPRRRRHDRHLVGRRPRRGPGRGVQVHDPDRATATCRGWTRTPATSPTRSATASSTTRPTSTGATTTSRCRPGTTWSSTRCTSGRSRRPADRAGHVRRRPAPAALPRAPRRVGRPGHAAVRVRRRHLVGLQPGPPVRHRVGLRRAGRVQARSSATRTRTGIAVIVDVVYNHLGPSDLDLWRFDGWARGRRRRDLLLQRRPRRHAVGRDPPRLRPRRGPDVPARQRDDLARGVPLRRPSVRFDRAHPDRRTATRPTRPRPLPDGWSFLAWINDEIRATPAVEDHDRRGPPGRPDRWSRRPTRAAPASPRSGTPGFIRGVRPALVASDDADRDIDAVVAGIVGEGRGASLEPGHLHRVARRGRQRPRPRARGDRARRCRTAGGRRSARCSGRRSS